MGMGDIVKKFFLYTQTCDTLIQVHTSNDTED